MTIKRQAVQRFVCETCGVQYAASAEPPTACRICEDDRQFVGWDGQQWTTLERLRDDYVNRFETMEPNLVRFGMAPSFGIGQHAYVVRSPSGNLLWDCVTLLDDETIGRVEALGGLRAIALSHPHYLSTVAEWSAVFGDIPIYIHAADVDWVTVPDARYEFWAGATQPLWDDLALVHTGGHFPGSCVAHWASGAGGSGALLAGDSVQVVHDRTRVSFMHSFVNYIPLSVGQVRGIADALEPFHYERIYSPWPGRIVQRDAEEVVRRSVRRYLAAIEGPS
jgi:hypothetical protein